MGQRFFWLRLLFWSLLCLYAQGFPVRRAKRTHENTEHVHISMLPNETVHLSLGRKEEHGKKEENIVNRLVVLLKDIVEKIPTQRPSETQPVITFHLEPALPVTADTLWMNRKPKNGGVQIQASQAASSTHKTAKTTTPFWRLRNDSIATIILHTTTTPSTETTAERLQSESSGMIFEHYDNTISETPRATVSHLLEKIITTGGKRKTSNQLPKGTLSKLVASMKEIDKVHGMLHKATDKPQQEGNPEKHMEGHQRKPGAAHNLIHTMMKTIRNSPPSVKNDPALHNNVEKAERLLQEDLKLVGEAEKRLKEAKDQEEEERQTSPSPLPNLAGSDMTIMLMPVSSDQEQEKKREQQISPSAPPHLTASDMTIMLMPVSSDQEQEKKREQQISPSPPPHLTASDMTIMLMPVSSDQEHEKKREQQISPSPPPHLTASDMTIMLMPVSSDQEQEKKLEQQISPSPPPHLTVADMTVQLTMVSSDSLAKEADETQVKNEELQSLIKLLYGFNGHAENLPNKKGARDMVNKTIAALDAIKTISSGKADKKSKQMLKQWFKKDRALAREDIRKS